MSIIGFIIGYQAPARPEVGYVHFIGVHPNYRRRGVATELYLTFARELKRRGARIVKGITADINRFSQTVHPRLGFSFVESSTIVDGVPIQLDYDGKGQHRVVFYKKIEDFKI